MEKQSKRAIPSAGKTNPQRLSQSRWRNESSVAISGEGAFRTVFGSVYELTYQTLDQYSFNLISGGSSLALPPATILPPLRGSARLSETLKEETFFWEFRGLCKSGGEVRRFLLGCEDGKREWKELAVEGGAFEPLREEM